VSLLFQLDRKNGSIKVRSTAIHRLFSAPENERPSQPQRYIPFGNSAIFHWRPGVFRPLFSKRLAFSGLSVSLEPLAKVWIVMRSSDNVLRKDKEKNRRKRSNGYVEDDFTTKTQRRALAADRNRFRLLQEACI